MKFKVHFTFAKVFLRCVIPVKLTTYSRDIVVTFVKSHPTPCGPIRLTTGWTTLSKSSCALNCRTRYGEECRGFMYNKVTRLCTPSSGLSGSFPAPAVTEGDLYLMRSPDIYPDFYIQSDLLGLTSASVAYYTNKLNYTDATSVCACLDSHLYMADTILKYNLISYIVSFADKVWIGLDDMATEGIFVWSGSGQVLELFYPLKFLIFQADQPDNKHGNENCVYKRENGGRLNDATCFQNMLFICEKTLI